jgi:hypothetical protein
MIHGIGFEIDSDNSFAFKLGGQGLKIRRSGDNVVAQSSFRGHFFPLDPVVPFA